jgi:hypothetical protein
MTMETTMNMAGKVWAIEARSSIPARYAGMMERIGAVAHVTVSNGTHTSGAYLRADGSGWLTDDRF